MLTTMLTFLSGPNFFQALFHYCLSSVYYCEDRFGLLSLLGGSVSLTDIEVQTFLEGEENQYTKLKTFRIQ